jgi:transposase
VDTDTDTTTLCDSLPRQPPCGLHPCQLLLWEARHQIARYKSLHQRACQREAKLKEQLAHAKAAAHAAATARIQQREAELQQQFADLQAEVRLLKHRLYGRRAESHHHPNTLAHSPQGANAACPAPDDAAAACPPPPPRRRRGHQRGRPGHQRRHHDHLPTTDETIELPPGQCHCATCGLPLTPCGSEPALSILEVEVRAHRRVIRRRRYRPSCVCASNPALLTAPPPPRLIANSALGTSIWVEVLLDKYAFHRPTYRLLAQWRLAGLDLALGTITDGLQRLLPLLDPVYQALLAHNQKQEHWHGDETRWLVFASVEGKVGHLWYLWLQMSAEAAVFVLACGRGHEVPEAALGPDAQGIFNVDRYTAYPAMQQVKDGQITLALCWAHQRRDFIEAERGNASLHAWASAWLQRIANLYRLNEARLQAGAPEEPAGMAAQQELQRALEEMAAASALEQARAELPQAARKALESLDAHWAGLNVFVAHREVPMDNNAAERAFRGPVVGRKNYYGSGAAWAGQLAARMFSVLQTLTLWKLNAREWLGDYLRACASNGGQPPADLRRWLPWRMSAEERAAWQLPQQPKARPQADSS